jgi:hypothetical protein
MRYSLCSLAPSVRHKDSLASRRVVENADWIGKQMGGRKDRLWIGRRIIQMDRQAGR